MRFRRGRLACSFCGKGEADVAKLVAGPRVYICDRCAALAMEIMNASGDPTARPPQSASWFRRALRKVAETARYYRRLDLIAAG